MICRECYKNKLVDMGIRRADIANELVPQLNKVFGIDVEFNMVMQWLATSHPSICNSFSNWQAIHTAPRNKHVLRDWVTKNHPELIPMIDPLETARCE